MATATLSRPAATLSADEVEAERVRLNGHRLFAEAMQGFGESHRKNATRPLRRDASAKHIQHIGWLCRQIDRAIKAIEKPRLPERPTTPNPTWVAPIGPRVSEASATATPISNLAPAVALVADGEGETVIAPGTGKHHQPTLSTEVALVRPWEAVEQHRRGFLAKHGTKLTDGQGDELNFELSADSEAVVVNEMNRRIYKVRAELAASREVASVAEVVVTVPPKEVSNNGWTHPKGGTVDWDKQASIPDRPVKAAATPAKAKKKDRGEKVNGK